MGVILLSVVPQGAMACPEGHVQRAIEEVAAKNFSQADALLQQAENCGSKIDKQEQALIHRHRGVVQVRLAESTGDSSYASGAVLSFFRALKKNPDIRLTGAPPPFMEKTFACAQDLLDQEEAKLPTLLWPCPDTKAPQQITVLPWPQPPEGPEVTHPAPKPADDGVPHWIWWVVAGVAAAGAASATVYFVTQSPDDVGLKL